MESEKETLRSDPATMKGWGRLQSLTFFSSASQGLLLAAIPLLAVSITTDPREISLVTAIGQSPWLLFSLFAGVLIDRSRRATVLMWSFGVLFCAAFTLALAGSLQAVTLPLLIAVAFVVTTSQVLGDGAAGALVPEVVPTHRLDAANARLQMIDRGLVQFVVPPITGLLLALAVGVPAWVACLMAVGALAVTPGIPSTAVVSTKARPLKEIAEGLRYLVATPLLSSLTVTVALGSFAASAGTAMLVLYATQVLGVDAIGYGLLLTCLAVGWLASSFVAHRIVARLGYAWSMRMSQACVVLVPLVIAVAPPWPVLVGAVLILLSAAVLVWNVCSQSTRQRFTPPSLLGRVLTTHRALSWGFAPLGALAGGMVAAYTDLRVVFGAVALTQTIGLLVVWRTLTPSAYAKAEDRMAT